MLADYLVPKSVWIIGGDGWAYDIGYGGLDHVLSTKHNVNILVLDTGVYSNTGGQASKATPLGASAKFAAHGKDTNKKDLGLMAMSYGHVYVASVALGAQEGHTLKAFLEAGSYQGPSLIIAYSHCIAQGYDLRLGPQQQKLAVDCGVWPLYRYDPRRADAGEPPLIVDAEGGKIPVSEYMTNETRFKMVEKLDPEAFRRYAAESQLAAERRMAVYRHMSQLRLPVSEWRRRGGDRRDDRDRSSAGKGGMIMDLSTTYLGLSLPNPFIAGPSPLTDRLDTIKRLEDAGIAAIVLPPLFEEAAPERPDGAVPIRSTCLPSPLPRRFPISSSLSAPSSRRKRTSRILRT